jgi:hypothetical protein
MIRKALKYIDIRRSYSIKRTISEIDLDILPINKTERDDCEQEKKRIKLKHILDSSKVIHKNEILIQENLKEAHVYCKINNLSGQISGPLIENYIKNKYNMEKNDPSFCIGDLNCNQKNIEIKISNGGKDNKKFNYVQLRMNHNCDYIFTAYYLDYINLNETGELFIFKLKKDEIKNLILKYGSYAHGTIKKLGKISKKDLDNCKNDKEYALRPKLGDKCWKELLRFRINDVKV